MQLLSHKEYVLIWPFTPEGKVSCQEVPPTPVLDPSKVPVVSAPVPGVTAPSPPLAAPALPPSSSDPPVLSGAPVVEPSGSDVVDEISKLLASDKVLEEDAGNVEEDNQELESIGLLEPDRVKQDESALDDKLTVELRSIVDQIQVWPRLATLNCLQKFH